jgi:hypothetical protein
MEYVQSHQVSIILRKDLKKFKGQITRDINGA